MVSDLLKALVLGPNILGLIAGLLVPAGLKWKPSAGLWLLAVMLNLLTVVTGLALTKLAAIGIAFGWCFWRYRRRTALQE
jgi:hypothetical protein